MLVVFLTLREKLALRFDVLRLHAVVNSGNSSHGSRPLYRVGSRSGTAVMEYLASSPVVTTTSLEEARDVVARLVLPHELVAPSDKIDMRLNAVNGRRMTVGYLAYGSEVDGATPPTQDCYIAHLTVGGRNRVARRDGARVLALANEGGFVYSPVQTHRGLLGPDAEHLLLKIPRVELEAHLADLLGRPIAGVLDFDFELDLRVGPGRALLEAVHFLATQLDRPAGLADMPLAQAHLEAYVLTTLLHSARHQFSGDLKSSARGRPLRHLAPVLEYIEAHTDCELTPETLARIGHVSVRTLHAAFQEQLDETPMAYVRKVRLHRVRADLLRSDPRLVGVTEIAMRWGFLHLSRFAKQYRDQFGELPSVTLQR